MAGGGFVFGQIEAPHTDHGAASRTDVPAPPAAPDNLDALAPWGFNLCAIAVNHAHDNGVPGIADTIEHLSARGIAVVGSSRPLSEAKTSAIVAPPKGITVAVLTYNAVDPRESWVRVTRT